MAWRNTLYVTVIKTDSKGEAIILLEHLFHTDLARKKMLILYDSKNKIKNTECQDMN